MVIKLECIDVILPSDKMSGTRMQGSVTKSIIPGNSISFLILFRKREYFVAKSQAAAETSGGFDGVYAWFFIILMHETTTFSQNLCGPTC